MTNGIEEILKIGVLDVKFGPKKYICVMANRRELLERNSINSLAREIANIPGLSETDTKINYDNKSAAEQYKDIRPFDDKELSYFKERLVIYKHECRKREDEMNKKYGNFYNFDDDKRKSWLDGKGPDGKIPWIE